MHKSTLPRDLADVVKRALDEDLGPGDVTTEAVVDSHVDGRAEVVAREPLVVCGMPVLEEVFRQVDPRISVTTRFPDGYPCQGEDDVLAEIEGPLAPILTGERVALNFLQRLSGIATWTRKFVVHLEGSQAVLVDTRKTTPGLRSLEKYAVRKGGAKNHRFHLGDGILVKDNHISAAGSVEEAVTRALKGAHHLLQIEVEVENLDQATRALNAGARVLLLDNFSLTDLEEAVLAIRSRHPNALLEASGGVRLETIRDIARTGIDLISCGALVHQARWVDISLVVWPE